jgi:hypothetical protein
MENTKISRNEIKEALSQSGYLIEQRVTDKLRKNFFVETNHIYLDPFTSKSREIDIKAISYYSKTDDSHLDRVRWSLYCECENNSQPVVFFPFKRYLPSASRWYIMCYGIPMKIWIDDDKYINLKEYLPFNKFHHYCKGTISTQYCSFDRRKDKGKWIATHLEEQHDTLNSLVYAVEGEVNDFYNKLWRPPKYGEKEPIYFEFIYPLIVLGGDLLEAHLGKRGLVVKPTKHIKCLKTVHFSGKEVFCVVDVITEDYLSEYVSMVEYEMVKVKNAIRRHKSTFSSSISQLLQDVKNTKKKDDLQTILTDD